MRWSEPAVLSAASLAISAAATAWARAHAHRRGMLDAPGERRSHVLPTPRGGGIGIALAGLCLCAWLGGQEAEGDHWWWIGAGLLLVAVAGWWDDHRPLPAWPRLLAHVMAGACLAAGAGGQGAPVIVLLAAFLLVPVLVNVWNFIDGIDGIAASQALLCALALACVLAGPSQALALGLAAACLGFLPFNMPRAKIFMGDVGSGALGYLLAVLLVAGGSAQPVTRWPLLLLPVAACLLDSGLTLAWRAVRGEAWWRPHVQHLYQRLARRHGHPAVTMAYAGWTTVAIGIMLAVWRASAAWAGIGAAVFVGLSVAGWWRLHGSSGDGKEGIDR